MAWQVGRAPAWGAATVPRQFVIGKVARNAVRNPYAGCFISACLQTSYFVDCRRAATLPIGNLAKWVARSTRSSCVLVRVPFFGSAPRLYSGNPPYAFPGRIPEKTEKPAVMLSQSIRSPDIESGRPGARGRSLVLSPCHAHAGSPWGFLMNSKHQLTRGDYDVQPPFANVEQTS
jgi:hypothetical protein